VMFPRQNVASAQHLLDGWTTSSAELLQTA
jgi:hypothetical protein